ncbi:unnamed protein product [Dracunculus medinensis]|uniref:MSP domain-containing protein n=1 Tax=Dracunculus medinensis TaxID=318479 RepID=A0A0N4U479_DRAME|nr:unnamed protein product [Dracunculus medinensis]
MPKAYISSNKEFKLFGKAKKTFSIAALDPDANLPITEFIVTASLSTRVFQSIPIITMSCFGRDFISG